MELRKTNIIGAVILGLIAGPALAGEMPMTTPENVGLSSERLARIGDTINSEIEAGTIAGGVMLVARHGKVAYLESYGMQDALIKTPMVEDSLFRLFSMTKPIVSVAVLMLHEQGKLLLNDPVSKYIPAFADTQVWVEGTGGDNGELQTEPQAKPVTIQDLLRHTSGMVYGLFGNTPVHVMYQNSTVFSWDNTSAEFAEEIAGLPLAHQPGTVWDYGQSTDVLARVIEVVSGQPMDVFLQENIFGPLGMTETGYWVDGDAANRVAEQLPNPETGEANPIRDVAVVPNWRPGGHGLVGSASDYWRFSQMLLNRGELDGVRLLSPTTVDYMTSDHLGDLVEKRPELMWWVGEGHGFGLGVAVRLQDGVTHWNGSAGDYYWLGYASTNFLVSPKNDMIVIFMAQQIPLALKYRDIVFSQVNQAIIEDATITAAAAE
jgi:CubicO group peptidase (beta-lactamase class C family)